MFTKHQLQNECSLIFKDAGFVYESLRIETNRVIWDFCFHKTNARNESFRFGFANLDSRIRSTRIRRDLDSRISIFKDSFCAIVLRIHRDSLDSWKQVKSFENWLDSWSRYEPNLFKYCDPRYELNLFKSGFVTYESIRIHGFAKRIHVFTNLLYESRILTNFPK